MTNAREGRGGGGDGEEECGKKRKTRIHIYTYLHPQTKQEDMRFRMEKKLRFHKIISVKGFSLSVSIHRGFEQGGKLWSFYG